MRVTSGIFFMFLFGLTACSAPEKETFLVGQIQCSGLPAMPEWVHSQVEDEVEAYTDYRMQNLDLFPDQFGGRRGCLGQHCLRAIGDDYAVDLVLGGSVDRVLDRVLIAWRLVRVNQSDRDWIWVNDYPYVPDQLETVIRSSIRQFIREIETELLVETKLEEPVHQQAPLVQRKGKTENATALCSPGGF